MKKRNIKNISRVGLLLMALSAGFTINIYAADNIYSNAKTDNSGKNIYVTFTRDIKADTINKDEFKIKIGNNDASIQEAINVVENAKQVKFTISDNVSSSNTLKIIYDEGNGNLTDTNGTKVASFEKTITNNYGKGAKYSSATVSTDGKTIKIKFSKALDSTSVKNFNNIISNNSAGFDTLKVEVGGTVQPINKIELTSSTELTITLSNYLNANGNSLYLSYTGSTLLTSGGAPVENFENKSISYSFVNPKISEATVNVDRDKVILLFNVAIDQDSLINVINSEQLTIKPSSTKDITFSGEVNSSDPRKVYLNLSDELKKSETVKVTYKTGDYELKSQNGKAVSSFTKTASKSTSTTAPKLEELSLNKDGDKLTLEFDEEISSIESSDENYGFTIQGKSKGDTNYYDVESYEISKKKLYLYIDGSVDASDNIKVKFDDDDTHIYGLNEAEVKSFGYKSVDNNVKTDDLVLKDCYTDASGQYIYLIFNQSVDDVGDEDNFIVKVNGTKQTISSVKVSSSNSKRVEIKLSSAVSSDDTIKVSYDPDNSDDGDPMISDDGDEAEIFENEKVTNSLESTVPKAKTASISSDGKTVTINMSYNIKSNTVKKEYFTVNDKSIANVSVSGSTITLTLNETVSGNAKISYNSFYMEGDTGNKVPPFIINTSGGPSTTSSGTWEKLPNGWQWKYSNGSIAKNCWVDTGNGIWYAFDANGWMRTGWFLENGLWFYLDGINGDMKTGWQFINNEWYYLNPISNGHRGAMEVGWIQDGGKWFYCDPTGGVMRTGWLQDNGVWYYLNPISDGTRGAMYSNVTKQIDGKSYTFDASGRML